MYRGLYICGRMMEVERVEFISEGWVRFRRIYCREGFIDSWQGDSINDPNNESKSNLQLNSFTTYYRLNGGGLWCNKRDFSRDFLECVFAFSPDYPAKEIWDVHYIN